MAKLSNKTIFVLMFCAALITAGFVFMFFSFYAVYKSYDLKMYLNISNTTGFNLDTDSINFGNAKPGNSNTRSIILGHDYDKPLLVQFTKTGNISGFVLLPQRFYLEPGVRKEVSLSAIIPEIARQGFYEGTLTVYFRRI